jgi:hypothetical protein
MYIGASHIQNQSFEATAEHLLPPRKNEALYTQVLPVTAEILRDAQVVQGDGIPVYSLHSRSDFLVP